MANHFYGHNYGGGAGGSGSSLYSSRTFADSYLSSDSSLRGSVAASRYSTVTDPLSDIRAPGISSTTTNHSYGPPGVEAGPPGSSVVSIYGGFKRTLPESLYHQNLYGDHSMIGQAEAWYSMNPLTKRLRYESTSHLPIYPQRPGERDCAYYMQTRNCKFGESCKFDHPIWVPEGGVPDWKEVPPVPSETLPERPGEPDCPYFVKTQRCKFGTKCKFNHPKDSIVPPGAHEVNDVPVLPERPSEPPCAFYMKTGKCKFGVTCKFHHPKDLQIHPAVEENDTGNNIYGDANPVQLRSTPALFHNTKGLPIRPGVEDCPFYLKTGSCKYGITCRYSHPDLNGMNPLAAAVTPTLLTPPTAHFNIEFAPPASLLPTYDQSLTAATLGLGQAIYPQRPGEPECDYYMKMGICKFYNCKFHHPIDRSAPMPSSKDLSQETVKLTLAGLPRREGAINCPYYMKTGTCKYGATCRFDHPPPGEVMAMATAIDEAKENGETV